MSSRNGSNSNSNNNVNFANSRAVKARVEYKMKREILHAMFKKAVQKMDPVRVLGVLKAGYTPDGKDIESVLLKWHDQKFSNFIDKAFFQLLKHTQKVRDPYQIIYDLTELGTSPSWTSKALPRALSYVKYIVKRWGFGSTQSAGYLDLAFSRDRFAWVKFFLKNMPTTVLSQCRAFRYPASIKMATLLVETVPPSIMRNIVANDPEATGIAITAFRSHPKNTASATIKLIDLYVKAGFTVRGSIGGHILAYLASSDLFTYTGGDRVYEHLIKLGAEVNTSMPYGSPLIQMCYAFAEEGPRTPVAKTIWKCIQLLLQHGANPNVARGGETPLSILLEFNATVGQVKYLVKHGADPAHSSVRHVYSFMTDARKQTFQPLISPTLKLHPAFKESNMMNTIMMSNDKIPLNKAVTFVGDHHMNVKKRDGRLKRVPVIRHVYHIDTMNQWMRQGYSVLRAPLTQHEFQTSDLVHLKNVLSPRDKKKYQKLFEKQPAAPKGAKRPANGPANGSANGTKRTNRTNRTN